MHPDDFRRAFTTPAADDAIQTFDDHCRLVDQAKPGEITPAAWPATATFTKGPHTLRLRVHAWHGLYPLVICPGEGRLIPALALEAVSDHFELRDDFLDSEGT